MTLACREIDYAYRRGEPVLRGVSASFPAGSVTAIVGPNGAGKSTLLRLLAGVAAPEAGSITLAGRALASLTPRRRAARLALVAQRPTVAGAFTVEDVVRLGRYALPRDDGAVRAALDALDLTAMRHAAVPELSVGQRQRVAIARALAQLGGKAEGAGLLLDEPTAALDPLWALAVFELLRAQARAGACVVMVVHDLTAALNHADHAVILQGGRVAGAGPVEEALTPAALAPIFGVGFAAVGSGGVRALVPRRPAQA
ncbi:MAG: ABC transporter ATP-binding protein [Planctomycetota bacterium]|nr:MAG: ABC transporter ATP-binding protein [Planctomycetota bacterium]